MNVLSYFDGMSCGQIALNKADVEVENYFACEIDKYAMKITDMIYPNTIQLGDITKVDLSTLPKIDLLIGGSSCQNFSFAGNKVGMSTEEGVEITNLDQYLKLKEAGFNFKGESYLFWEFVKALRTLRPKYFLLENVKMDKKWSDVITEALGVDYVEINSNLVSAQNRKRLYWTNVESVVQPEDKGIELESILEDLPDCPVGIRVREKSNCVRVGGRNSPFGSKQVWDPPFQRISKKGKVKPGVSKAACFTAGANSGGNHSDMDILHTPWATRRYSVREAARLQTIPENIIDKMINSGVSNSQLYKMLGNGWTVDVIAHIFKGLV